MPCTVLRHRAAVVRWCRDGVVAWWRGGVVAWWRGGVVAWWRGGVVAWWRGGVVAWWRARSSGTGLPWWRGAVRLTDFGSARNRLLAAILTPMAKIITVAAYKGGVGKTTLALELAYLLDAPLVDLDWDKGGATRRWGYKPGEASPLLDALARDKTPRPRKGRRKPDLVAGDEDFGEVQPDADTMTQALEKWAAEWGRPYVVIDTHPGGLSSTHGAMAAASLVVTPTVLATGELDGLEGLLERAADYPLLVVPNKVQRVPDANLLRRLQNLVARYDVPVGPVVSEHRRLPRRSARMAISAFDPVPKAWERYAHELVALAGAVRSYGDA